MFIPSYAVLFLPLVAVILSGWFCHARLAATFNALISLIVIIGCAVMYTRLTGPLIGSQVVSIMVITGYSAAIMYGPLRAMHEWFIAHMTSPFASLSSITISIQRTPPAEQRQSLRQWQPSPVTPLPPSRGDDVPFHRERTSPIPAIPPQPQSRPLTLTPPPYPQQERMQP